MMKKPLIFLFIICTSFVLTLTSTSFGSQFSWEGTWNTTYKKMILTQNGNRVSGTYGHDNGKIFGSINGNTLEGTWHEDGNQTGKMKFEMSGDGKSFSGKWGNNTNVPSSAWTGNRISKIIRQPSIKARNGGSNHSWAGTWNTTYKKMILVQTGNHISGTYGHDNGKVSGTINGKVFNGTWHEDGNQTGKFRFNMSGNGKTFSGKWGNNSGPLTQAWNGTRTTPIAASPVPTNTGSQNRTSLDSVDFNSRWKVEDARNGKNQDYSKILWTFSIDGTVSGGRMWRGLWGQSSENSIKIILMDSSSNTDEFAVSFFNDGTEFVAFKNGTDYRYGKKL